MPCARGIQPLGARRGRYHVLLGERWCVAHVDQARCKRRGPSSCRHKLPNRSLSPSIHQSIHSDRERRTCREGSPRGIEASHRQIRRIPARTRTDRRNRVAGHSPRPSSRAGRAASSVGSAPSGEHSGGSAGWCGTAAVGRTVIGACRLRAVDPLQLAAHSQTPEPCSCHGQSSRHACRRRLAYHTRHPANPDHNSRCNRVTMANRWWGANAVTEHDFGQRGVCNRSHPIQARISEPGAMHLQSSPRAVRLSTAWANPTARACALPGCRAPTVPKAATLTAGLAREAK